YVKTGKLSFNVQTVQPIGIGDLHKQMEQLKAKLAEEGVFSPEHKKPIPVYPRDVCVITSKTGAVIRDICRTVRLVNRSLNIHVYNARVQGDGAENEIVEGIKRTDGRYDVIIVARGGGSFEDLAPFNTEVLARAIYDAETPIISAVGHETDFTICDFAADARAATPTAAAHMVAFNEEETKSFIFNMLSQIGLKVQDMVKDREKELSALVKTMTASASLLTERAVAKWRVKNEKLLSAARVFTTNKETMLEKTLITYGAANPLNSLNKGFFSASIRGKRIVSVADALIGDELTLQAKDGKLLTTVKEIKYDV
ncbi:MAG: exodeoxyribonuclease VII large subunit, partial [Clostridia bacterium]|nr:exodeoxyribonuclease VII large subunit [Clostridia bacterium]